MDIQSSSSSDLTSSRNRIPDYLLDTPICQAKKKMKLAKDQTGTMPIQLPTHWNPKDKCALLELSKGNLRVSYNGTGKNDSDAAAVRANHPMPYQCGLFYFEVTIISKGQSGYIGIGFCTSSVDLKKLPGWENYSWGYHGDDGHSFCFSGTGKAYGPTFTTKDTIGCCINFMDMTVFYTKNGVNLGIAFRDIKNDHLYYPAIGLRTPGEIVEANFGQKKFKFDIENCIKEEKAKLWHYINTIELPILKPDFSNITNINNKSSNGLNELVLQYLVHHGYSETAQTFYNNAFAKNDKSIKQDENKMEECDVIGAGGLSGIAKSNEYFDIESLKNRQRIKEYVMKGDIDSAIDITNRLYPTVLANNDILLFNLRCRKFIEMIRKNEELDMDTEIETIDEDAMDAMDVDDDKNKALCQRIIETMKYGQELQSIYGQDERDEIKDTLTETFSLFAYEHPNNSILSYLLEPSRREIVANQLNVAILESQGEPSKPAIETLYRQSAVAVRELVKNNVGSAAFINVKKDCLM
ncbi:SPRY-domain-containing protein [Neocallimastix lanati (nom. inval.)]|uniref:SPRY-domain-containing protein n=1 Tax=Neocallimastix californiae TaxID=1754190 RepID=A0A1Y2DD82_9FUNG|nr:SPRY-domain-containing protein [Neocallimastix sp. JGI-2020a]ORY57076.1 SPRY-domain-containing protein [Neocallimastix californiae]|eukprot:ORY57076.1 SPRY-domain-containing protein [Neocallimastix californiae]